MGVVFVESASLVGYTARSDEIGGAEASLAKVAEGLAAQGIPVTVVVAKLPADHAEEIAGVTWLGPGAAADEAVRTASALVVQRRIGVAATVRRANRKAPLFVWYHDWSFPPGPGAAARAKELAKATTRALIHRATRATAVVVSHTHAANLREHLGRGIGGAGVRVEVVSNPVDQPGLAPGVEVDPDKLVFFSARWKGLDQVVETFRLVRQEIPSLELHVASPGYSAHDSVDGGEHVHQLGYLRHDELFAQVQSALCVFYPADVVPETFGLVFLESHAVGTPVLAHPFGAAPELLTPGELVDAHDVPAIAARLQEWRAGGRPAVAADPAYGVDAVVAHWQELL